MSAPKPVHRTQELVAELRSMIEGGELPVGSPIPSERLLSQTRSVSRTTVRRAIEILVDEGLLYRLPGSGTYVGREPQARSTLTSDHAAIGIVLPTFSNPFFSELVTAIERECRNTGFQLLLGQSREAGNYLVDYLTSYADNPAVKGVITTATGNERSLEHFERLRQAGKPYVFVVREVQVSGADTVATDHVAGAREITEYLLQLGHRQIAYIGVQTLHSSRHFRGYLEALHEAGVTVDPRLQIHIGRSDLRNLETVGELGVEQLYAQDVPFTAVFAQIDPIAIGVLRALRARGVSVPDQVSVVGFDNIPSAEHVHPPLTTVDHTVAEIGRLAVLLLQDRIVGRYDGPSRRVIIQPRLMIRGSCGPAPEL